MCSNHLGENQAKARISGLDNDVPYQVLVVGYDAVGNPVMASKVMMGTPRATTDLWEQCEAQGGVCGEGGFCSCHATPAQPRSQGLALLGLGLLGLLGLARRRVAG